MLKFQIAERVSFLQEACSWPDSLDQISGNRFRVHFDPFHQTVNVSFGGTTNRSSMIQVYVRWNQIIEVCPRGTW